jgi:cytosine/adenosine deaminase-related metal-dependent hydrolase
LTSAGRARRIEADYVLAGPGKLIRDGAVIVRDGFIEAVIGPGERRGTPPDAETHAFGDAIVMAGLVNAHQHGRGLSQVQLGYHDDFLEPWIAGRRARGPLDGAAVTRLVAARMLANGVTATIHANYSYATGDYEQELRGQIEAYRSVGLRHTMCVGAMDRGLTVYPPHEACFMAGLSDELKAWLAKPGAPPPYCKDGPSTVALMTRLRKDYEGEPLVRMCYGPAGPQWVSDELWKLLARDARDNDLGMHLHALESPAQRDAARELFPDGVFRHLRDLGAMTTRTVAAHAVWADARDIEVLEETGACVVRNPGCNIRMRNGIAPLARFLDAGVPVAVGTDNCSMQDDEDLLSELRLAGCLGREPDWNAPPPPGPDDLISMATVHGARAGQFEGETGLLEPGMRADIAVFSLENTRTPYLDDDMPAVDAFLMRGRGSDAVMTMVGGEILYLHGAYTKLDFGAVMADAARAAANARVPADPSDIARTKELRDRQHAHYRRVASDQTQRS